MPRLRFIAGAAGALFLAACSSLGSVPQIGADLGLGQTAVAPEAGLVVGDEPYAVKAGAAILAQGGSAADAATAMYFALAVSYPAAAGLGGGGLCVVHDPASGRDQAIEFFAGNDATGGGDFAVPGNVRGFATLQTVHGRLPWQRDIALGEGMAAAGFPISSALAAQLLASQNVVRLDAGLAAEFLDESGMVKPAGTVVANPALAATLSAIREHGPDGFYRGAIAQKIEAYSAGEGGAIRAGDLAAYRANIHPPQTVTMGNEMAYLPPASAGGFAAALLSRLLNADGTLKAAGDPAAATAAATRAALEKFGIASLPKDQGATGFAALDKEGQAVACAVTMNGPFGSGHTADGTGVTLASAPSAGQAGLAEAFLAPMIATAGPGGPVSLAGAGAGGSNGTAAIAYALLRLALGQDMTKPGNLRSSSAAFHDTVNAIICQQGICATLPDPAAHGLGAAAGG